MLWMSFHYNNWLQDVCEHYTHIANRIYKFLSLYYIAIPSLILMNEKGGVITTERVTYVFNDLDGEVATQIAYA